MAIPVLRAKLHIPHTRPELVSRPRLIERLNEGLHLGRRFTLISAPAGYGKTTLLSEWLHAKDEEPASLSPAHVTLHPPRVAWLSLDEADSDPARFLAYLAAALQSAVGEDEVATGPTAQLSEAVLAPLLDVVSAVPATIILVLDDYHRITAQAVHDALAFLLDHAPNNLHLILATRADPPFPLARLRGQGQLTELRQADLRFTQHEAIAFLEKVTDLSLSSHDVAVLNEHTEGWVAGLQMAALSMRNQEDVPGFVAAFAGSHRYILDYLLEEVLYREPEHVQAFLLQTSILERLCGPLCDAILAPGGPASWGAAPDSQSVLEYLERSNLFITPLDDHREWYRYHQLFIDLLRQRLHRISPDLTSHLHRRASTWYAEHAMLPEAIEHSLAAQDYAQAMELISQIAEATLMRSEITTLMRWLDALPEAVLRQRADLCAFHAWTLLVSGQPWEMVQARLTDAAAEGGREPVDSRFALSPHSIATLRAFVALFQGHPERGMELARLALEHLPEDSPLWRNLASLAFSVASATEGQTATDVQALEEVAKASQAAGNILVAVMALCSLAELHARWGQLHRAQGICRQALDLATDIQGHYLPIASEALMGLGMLAREWNELDAALGYLTQGVTLARQRGEVSATEGYIALAFVRQALGDAKAACEAMDQAQQLARKFDLTESDDLVVDMSQARLSIAQGDLDAASRWAERRGLTGSVRAVANEEPDDYVTSHLRKYEHLVLARLWLAQGRNDDVLLLLEAALPKFRARQRPRAIIEAEILRALAHQARGDAAQAAETLAHALTLAAPEGYLRLFLDEGVPLHALLSRAAQRGAPEDFVGRLQAAFATEAQDAGVVQAIAPLTSSLPEPLSERELEVLRFLPTSLSATEIAQELFLSVHTVRSHLKAIYAKLDAHSRYEAIARAQALHLL